MAAGVHGRLALALGRLPIAPIEDDLLQSAVEAACTCLGATWAVAWRLEASGAWVMVARHPADWVGLPAEPRRKARGELLLPCSQERDGGDELLLHIATAKHLQEINAFASVVGRLLCEARQRTRLTERVEELTDRESAAERRYHDLVVRMQELDRELDSAGRRQLVVGERHRIAQDLHDRAAQTFFLINLKANWLLSQVEWDWPLRHELDRLQELSGQGSDQVREAIYALRASELKEAGLPGALHRLVRDLEGEGMAASLTVTGLATPLASDVEDALYKIALEAVTNVRKHSRASSVVLALRFTPGLVTLAVQDDGQGLPDDRIEPDSKQLGLQGMRKRVKGVGGELALMPGDDGGLIVRATIPTRGGREN
jgi:signal transduction histidine kinase